jgi:hypothetical protein
MRPSRHNDIRAALLRAEDGLTTKELGIRLDATQEAIVKAIPLIYGVYIDRWQQQIGRGKPAAVYMCVPVPDNTPPPEPRKKK